MTDTNSTPDATPPTDPNAKGPGNGRRGCGQRGFRRRGFFLLGLALLTGLAGFGIGKATGAHRFGPLGAGFGMHQPLDTDALLRRVDGGVDHMLSRVDATPEQKTKITAITKSAISDLSPLRETHRALQDKLMAALKADKVEPAALEGLRAEHMAMADTLSKRATKALSEVADVLTPAQRAKLLEQYQSRR